MNNDMEKDLQEVNPEELNEEPVVAEIEALEESAESTACCHDCSACAGCAEEAISEEVYESPKKKAKIVTPIIIAAVSFALVAAIVFGGIWIYNAFFGTSLKGVWIEQGFEDSGVYFELDDDGNIYLRGGGISYYGNYETVTYDLNKDTELPEIITKISEKEALSGKVNVFKSDFYMFGMSGGEFIYSLGSTEGQKSATFKYIDTTGNLNEWVFTESKLPELKYDPSVITNASADEAGIKTLVIDKNIIGTWSEADYGTYTFYDDGTANYKTKYQIDQSYQMFYGVTMGYGVDLDFKYTVGDGKIYMGVDYFTGETNDGVMTYFLDGKNLVIDGVGYAKVETK